MSIATSGRPVARRRFLSGVALVALIAGAAIALARLHARLAPVALPRLEAAAAPTRPQAAQPASATLARHAFMRSEPQGAEPERQHVMIAPELRVEHAVPAEYAIVKERILLEPERRIDLGGGRTQIIPPRYGYRDRRVETRPARIEIETLPAVWERREPGSGRSG